MKRKKWGMTKVLSEGKGRLRERGGTFQLANSIRLSGRTTRNQRSEYHFYRYAEEKDEKDPDGKTPFGP